jgi:hypothetical protein
MRQGQAVLEKDLPMEIVITVLQTDSFYSHFPFNICLASSYE